MFAQDRIASWVEERFECGERKYLPEVENLDVAPTAASGWFVACKCCGGLGPRYMVAPKPTLDVVARVVHRGDCETQFLFEVLLAREAA